MANRVELRLMGSNKDVPPMEGLLNNKCVLLKMDSHPMVVTLLKEDIKRVARLTWDVLLKDLTHPLQDMVLI